MRASQDGQGFSGSPGADEGCRTTPVGPVVPSAADLLDAERGRRFAVEEKLLGVIGLVQSRAPELTPWVRSILVGQGE